MCVQSGYQAVADNCVRYSLERDVRQWKSMTQAQRCEIEDWQRRLEKKIMACHESAETYCYNVRVTGILAIKLQSLQLRAKALRMNDDV